MLRHAGEVFTSGVLAAVTCCQAFSVATIVVDAALDLLHTFCFDEVCSCGALCDNGMNERFEDGALYTPRCQK